MKRNRTLSNIHNKQNAKKKPNCNRKTFIETINHSYRKIWVFSFKNLNKIKKQRKEKQINKNSPCNCVLPVEGNQFFGG